METIDICIKYSKYLIEHYFNRNQGRIELKPYAILYLLELYGITKSSELKDVVDLELNYLITSASNLEQDYSIKSGRGMHIYLLIKKYQFDRNNDSLEKAIELIKESDRIFLESPYTSNGLLDGRSGVLVLLIKLYTISHQEDLKKYIQKFIYKILQDVSFNKSGCYWLEPYKKFAHINDFSFGNLGVLYSFKFFNQIFKNTFLKEFELSICQNEIFSCVNNVLPLNNFKSIPLVSAKLDPNSISEKLIFDLNETLIKIIIGEDTTSDTSENIFERMNVKSFKDSKTAISLLHLYHSDSETVLGKKKEFINYIKSKVDDETWDLLFDEESLLGNQTLTNMYFLLNSMDKPGKDSIVFPFFSDVIKTAEKNISFEFDLTKINHARLSKDFPKTVMIADLINNQIVNSYFTQVCLSVYDSNHSKFVKYINRIIETNEDNLYYRLLNEALRIDLGKVNASISDISPELILEKNTNFQYISTLLDKPTSWLLDQKLIISDTIQIIKPIYEWKNVSALDKNILLNLSKAKNFIVFTTIDNAKADEVFIENDFHLLLDIFQQETSVQEALDQTYYVLNSFEEEKIFQISKNIGLTNVYSKTDFLTLYNNTILMCLRKWIQIGILKFTTT